MIYLKLLVVDNVHLYKNKHGEYFSPSIYDDDFFNRYADVFEEIHFCAKIFSENEINEEKYIKITRKDVKIIELPGFRGIMGLLKNLLSLTKTIKKSIINVDACILRAVQVESLIAYLHRRKTPYIIELVNDPKTYFKGIYRMVSVFLLNKMIKNAIGISYITKNVLQEKYPIKSSNTITSSYLTIDLDDSVISHPKHYELSNNEFKLIHVSNNIESDSKGYSTTIRIIKYLHDKGYNASITFVGEGSLVNYYIKMANDLGITDKVHFIGRIHDKYRLYDILKKSDLFIFPTKHEGLGRVNLEAQACGLPVLSSKVGGVIELFEQKYLFDPLDFIGYGDKIIELINNPSELNYMSLANIENAKKYTISENYKIRKQFYLQFRKIISSKTS